MIADWPVLSTVIWLPIIGGLMVLGSGDKAPNVSRWLALAVAVLTFLLSIPLWSGFDPATAEMQFVEKLPWVTSYDVYYYLGVDGISMPLILLTSFITILVVIAGWEVIQYKPASYMAAFLIMEGVMIGVFAALDAMLFYVFWEAMLIPMFLIIGVWGGAEKGLRDHQVLPLYLPRLGFHAGRADLHVFQVGQYGTACLPRPEADPERADTDFHCIFTGIRCQGANVAGAHLVAGRAR